MPKKQICSLLIGLVLSFCGANAQYASKVHAKKQPNIIIFLVDDMGLMDSSVPFITDKKGSPMLYDLNGIYNTPNLEKLTQNGIRFSHFYAHSVCSPTRISIMTGQNAARHKTTNWILPEEKNSGDYGPEKWNWKGLSNSSLTLPRILKEQGYKTIHVGKAHFGPRNSEGENPLQLGFDVNIGGSSIGMPASYFGVDGFGNSKGRKKRAVEGLEKYHGTDIFLTEALTLEAKKEIRKAHNEKQPFFLHMAHYAVHSPFQFDPKFKENYDNLDIPLKAKAYASMIEGVDKSLGDIVRLVKELNVGNDTLILFLGDNGSDAPLQDLNGYSSSMPLKGKKATHWEGGMRVPFVAAWITPQKNYWQSKLPIKRGSIQTQMGTVFDIFSTIVELHNISLPKTHLTDGYSLRKQFEGGKNKSRKNRFLNHYPHPHRSSYFTSLVDNNWKLIYHYNPQSNATIELYHLKKDPFEKVDVAKIKKKKLSEMIRIMDQDLERMGALLPEKQN